LVGFVTVGGAMERISQSGNGRTAGKGKHMAGSIFAAVVWQGAVNVFALTLFFLLALFCSSSCWD